MTLRTLAVAFLVTMFSSNPSNAYLGVFDEPRIAFGRPTLPPLGHTGFCLKYRSDCLVQGRHAADAQTTDLIEINSAINKEIKPKRQFLDGEHWLLSPETGDCNDYAVTKRHELIESGLPSRALRLSVVKTASGAGHLVLVVMTTRGDLVMDNLTQAIRPWRSTGYQWLKIQSATDAKFWYEVRPPASGPSISQVDQKLRLADR